MILGGCQNLTIGDRSAVVGGSNITATDNDTVYVPYLNIQNVGATTPVSNLAVDGSGNVVIGTTTTDYYLTGLTFDNGTFDLTASVNDGNDYTVSLAVLSSDMTVTGGTYNPVNGVASFTTNSGNTFDVSGFTSGYTDVTLTGATLHNGELTLTNSDGSQVFATGFTDYYVTGGTYDVGAGEIYLDRQNGSVTISGIVDTYVTGVTYNNSTGTLVVGQNNGQSNINVSGFLTTDVKVTGATYDSNIGQLTIGQTGGDNVSVIGFQTQNTFVTGATYSNGILTLGRNDGGVVTASGFINNDFFVTGGTYNNANGLITLNRQNGVASVSGLPAGLASIPAQIVLAGTGAISTLRTGASNLASAPCATVFGSANNAAGTVSGILGGISSCITTLGYGSTVGGGATNTITNCYSKIGGGQFNCVAQPWSSILGGKNNVINSCSSAIGGGENNVITASVPWSTIAGGCGNNIGSLASYSSAVGRLNTVCLSDTHVLGCNITTDQCFTTFVNNLTVNGGGIPSPNTCSRVTLKSLPTESEIGSLPSGTVYRCTTSASGGGTQLWIKL
jgi:hypothetical protein